MRRERQHRMGQLPMRQPGNIPLHWSGMSAFLLLTAGSAFGQSTPALRVVVNSNQDGPVQADNALTLREAIELINGTLPLERLSEAERSQVQPAADAAPRIDFNLPADQTTIRLTSLLSDLTRPGLVIDGTTQPGYEADTPIISELPLRVPIVAITPAEGVEVFRGLTVTADGITIRGLSLYGFTSNHRSTASTPPADIFIAHRFPPPDIRKHPTPANFSPFYSDDVPPKDVVIENNWLGTPPSTAELGARGSGVPVTPETRSAFGVSVFNGVNTTIRRNWIANHDGSAIITSVQAAGMKVTENALTGNGVAGMPDAIRLEGGVNQAQITGNLICANDGSGVYLFKPDGAVQIQDNQIIYNGRRLRRSAVYLMGSNHQVSGNQIRFQTGPGVVVAAYPRSTQNQIQTNRFSNLEGLSIDLVTDNAADVYDYQRGDGPNPARDTSNRRRDTGNASVNAPQFVTQEFFALGTQAGKSLPETPLLQAVQQVTPVQVFGTADIGTQIELYRVVGTDDGYGPLGEPIATATTDAQGKFSATIDGLRPGERISAIATHPTYGTSEPARTAVIRLADSPQPPAPAQPTPSVPRCTTPPAPPPAPPTPTPPPEPVRLQVPTNIHFALDRDNISPASAKVLDRIAQVLRDNPAIIVDLAGHTDPRASDAYNLALGARRARNARNYLLRRGIAPERMTIRSAGERQRRTTGRSRLDYARDRRVEFTFRDARGLELIVQEEDLQIEGGRR